MSDLRYWVGMQGGFLKVQEMVEDYFDEGLEISFDKVCNQDSRDLCNSWTIVRLLVGNEVRNQLDRDQDFLQNEWFGTGRVGGVGIVA